MLKSCFSNFLSSAVWGDLVDHVSDAFRVNGCFRRNWSNDLTAKHHIPHSNIVRMKRSFIGCLGNSRRPCASILRTQMEPRLISAKKSRLTSEGNLLFLQATTRSSNIVFTQFGGNNCWITCILYENNCNSFALSLRHLSLLWKLPQ
jgi:hypothetical protein